ncbi:MAG: DNA polymerase III subunit delta [Desulfovibrionaceae bacterium]|nr:DNA polymerase III subunit delta [Desulfovibrionaceae bacterium]
MAKTLSEPAQPTVEDARSAFAEALAPALGPARGMMLRMRESPPQVLILEGGTDAQRFSLALWHAALLNCPSAAEKEGPCLSCPACLQIGALFFQDLTLLDGREGTISIDAVRTARQLVAEEPRGGGQRVILIADAQALSIAAANALLKVMEEPHPKTCFLLLAPQRERLLPTLVSRGWTLTLPWTDPDISSPEDSETAKWLSALCAFLSEGQGLFSLTASKGSLDAGRARRILAAMQKHLAASRMDAPPPGTLAALFAALGDAGFAYACDVLAQGHNSLDAMVSPALVLEWAAVRLFAACRASARKRR